MKKVFNYIIVLIILISYMIVILSYSLNATLRTFTIDKNEILNEEKKLPILNIKGDIYDMFEKDDIRDIKVEYKSEKINFTKYATLKPQGSSSLNYDKINYTIKFFNDSKHKKKYKIDFGWGFENKYCLKANYVDKSHTRNISAANIAATISQKYNILIDAPNNGNIDGFPIEIYNNDEFYGLYTLNIPKDEWTFSMNKENENHLVFTSEGYEDTNLFLEEANYVDWKLEIGEETDENLDKLNRVINFVKDSSDEEFVKDINKYIDKDALLNYLVLVETLFLSDNKGKNLLLVTYDGKLWYPILYDLDTAYGTKFNGQEELDYEIELLSDENLLIKRTRELFGKDIANRYFELREDILTKEFLLNETKLVYQKIPSKTFEKELEKWPDIQGFDINQIEKYLDIRLPIVDKIMLNYYDEKPSCNNKDLPFCKFQKKDSANF